MDKYYFVAMEDSRHYETNWLDVSDVNIFTEEELKNRKITAGNIEYKIIPLSELKEFMDKNKNYKLYKKTLLDLVDKEVFDYINQNIILS